MCICLRGRVGVACVLACKCVSAKGLRWLDMVLQPRVAWVRKWRTLARVRTQRKTNKDGRRPGKLFFNWNFSRSLRWIFLKLCRLKVIAILLLIPLYNQTLYAGYFYNYKKHIFSYSGNSSIKNIIFTFFIELAQHTLVLQKITANFTEGVQRKSQNIQKYGGKWYFWNMYYSVILAEQRL